MSDIQSHNRNNEDYPDIVDPSVQEYQDAYDMEDNETQEGQFSSEYLKTLYEDYKTKLKSANVYLERIKQQQDKLTQVVEHWTHDLKDKFTVLDTFTKSRTRTTIPGDFAIEDRNFNKSGGNSGDLKKIDTQITDHSEQINYAFNKLDDYIKFLGQTYYDAQDTINKIYDRFMELYDNM